MRFLKKTFYLFIFLDGGEEREKERERNIHVWLPLMCPLLGIWPATQACALTGNGTSDPLVHRPVLNPLNHTSQSPILLQNESTFTLYPLKYFCRGYYSYYQVLYMKSIVLQNCQIIIHQFVIYVMLYHNIVN